MAKVDVISNDFGFLFSKDFARVPSVGESISVNCSAGNCNIYKVEDVCWAVNKVAKSAVATITINTTSRDSWIALIMQEVSEEDTLRSTGEEKDLLKRFFASLRTVGFETKAPQDTDIALTLATLQDLLIHSIPKEDLAEVFGFVLQHSITSTAAPYGIKEPNSSD